MDQAIWLLRSAYAAVGCALRSAHPNAAEVSSLCSAHAAVGCVLPSLHPNGDDFRCSAVRTPLWVAYCVRRVRMLRKFRLSAARTPLWAACCLRCIRMPTTFVALQCARRCGLRIAFVASECGRISSLCAISLLCGAHAAVGCALLCYIRMPESVVALPRARRCGLRVALLHPYVYRKCFPGRRFK